MLWTLSEWGDEWIHYHASHSAPFFRASQLVCLAAYQPACLITCPHTERLSSRLKGHGRGWGEKLLLFTITHFEREMCWVDSKPHCLPPLLTVQPLSINLSDRPSSSLPVYLNIPVSSLRRCNPPCPLTPEYLSLLDISITVIHSHFSILSLSQNVSAFLLKNTYIYN